MNFLRRLFRVSSRHYDLRALVSSRILESLDGPVGKVHVFCDLDKTYLETEFESWIKMAKIPFESPHDKITVPGANEVLDLLRWGKDPKECDIVYGGIHFVSSSPPQLRLALDGKMTLDHLEWSSDTFKNQSYNLRMARIDLLRHHIAYKTKAILDIAVKLPAGSKIVMFGDNAEFDAFIYTGVRLFIERRMGLAGLRDWLRGAKVEEEVIEQVLSKDVVVPENITVAGIYIRNVPGYEGRLISRFAGTWYQFEHWAQVIWNLMQKGLIDPSALLKTVRNLHNLHGVPLAHLRWCLYRVTEEQNLSQDLKESACRVLEAIGSVGASGPSRKMQSWELNLATQRDIETIGTFEAKTDSSQWYHSIEDARLERKRKRQQKQVSKEV